MNAVFVTDKEYEKLIGRLEFFDTMRNNLLTFSFTAVLTALGAAVAMNLNSVSVWLCMLPFCLIIPFSARIAYYRLASAHISSFLRTFSAEQMQFELGTRAVTENQGKIYPLIAWLVNHEMVLLGLATSGIFYLKYVTIIKEWSYYNYLGLIVPVICTAAVYLIAHSTYNYKKLLKNFEDKWEIMKTQNGKNDTLGG